MGNSKINQNFKKKLHFQLNIVSLCAVFEIALVRLFETSDYLLGQVNNPLAVSVGQVEIYNNILFFTIILL